jgi:hypothetical protein
MIGLTLFLILVYMLLFIAYLMFISYLYDKFKIDFDFFIVAYVAAILYLMASSVILILFNI